MNQVVGAGALIRRVTVRFLHPVLTQQRIGFVPVVGPVAPGVRPAGALLSRRKPVFLDPHEDSYTISVVDANGVELARAVFPTSAVGYLAGVELVNAHGVSLVAIEGSAGRGAHAAIAFVAAGVRLP